MPYFVSLGSNIEPRQNLALMVRELLRLAPIVRLSRVVETEPVGVVGAPFLNAVAAIDTRLAPAELKARFNGIEAALGRDRSDPDSKTKSRPADLDVLFHLGPAATSLQAEQIPPEPYVRPLLLELLALLGVTVDGEAPELPPGVALSLDGLAFGAGPRVFSRLEGRLVVADLAAVGPGAQTRPAAP